MFLKYGNIQSFKLFINITNLSLNGLKIVYQNQSLLEVPCNLSDEFKILLEKAKCIRLSAFFYNAALWIAVDALHKHENKIQKLFNSGIRYSPKFISKRFGIEKMSHNNLIVDFALKVNVFLFVWINMFTLLYVKGYDFLILENFYVWQNFDNIYCVDEGGK